MLEQKGLHLRQFLPNSHHVSPGYFLTGVPHRAQNASRIASVAAQLAQTGRVLGAEVSGCTGLIGEPHFVQNLSLGSASLPHEEQVQPVRRNLEIRELTLSPANAGAGDTGMGAAGCCPGYVGQGAAAGGSAAAAARLTS